MWGYIGAAIATVIVVVLIVAALKPGHFQIQRSAMIGAPPAVIYGYIADFRKWTQWSPWERIDPNLRRTYSGADHGVGAVYAWDSNNSKAGAGRMEITKAAENTLINLDLDAKIQHRAHNTDSRLSTAERFQASVAEYGGGGDKVFHWSGGDLRLRRSKIQPVVRHSFVLGTKGSRRDVCRGGLRGGSTVCFQ